MLEDEDPQYGDCPDFCTRRESDQERGCPDCWFQRVGVEFKDELENLFGDHNVQEKRERDAPLKWSIDELVRDVQTVAALNGACPEGYPPRWNARQRTLVSLYRRERSKLIRMNQKRDSIKQQAELERLQNSRR